MRQFAVIGLGRFGFSIAKTLVKNKCQVLAIDIEESAIEDISDIVTHAVKADATDEKTLRSLDIGQMDVGIVCLGKVESSIMISLLLKELGVKMVVARALTGLHAKVLRKIGVDKIVFPERDMGERTADSLVSPNIFEHIELSPDYSVVEIAAPAEFAGKNLRDINVRAKFKVTVIAIKSKVPSVNEEGETEIIEEINIAPVAETEVKQGDILVIIGMARDIEKLRER